MNFSYTGLFISVLILLTMLVSCHLSNYFFPKNKFIDLATPTATPSLKYNQITYSDSKDKVPCDILSQAQIPCNQVPQCGNDLNGDKKVDNLSDSEIAMLYKHIYDYAGIEVINRALLQMDTPTTTTAS